MLDKISAADIEKFQINGAQILRGMISKEWIENIRDGIDVNL